MNYHDTRFARRMGETPLRPDYASAIERTRPYPRTLWVTMAAAMVYLAGLLLWELL